ncbi:MAG TPA: FAD-binding protein, partial [Streptosporangiaceae bacterium]|nr:FAD-binding protein [Streptosporangiaceae bacterium]
MDTERTVVPAARAALAAACPALREGAEQDAIGGAEGLRPAFVASPASTDEAAGLMRAAAAHDLAVVPRG